MPGDWIYTFAKIPSPHIHHGIYVGKGLVVYYREGKVEKVGIKDFLDQEDKLILKFHTSQQKGVKSVLRKYTSQ